MIILNNRLRYYRLKKKLSKKELASKVDDLSQNLSAYENEEIRIPLNIEYNLLDILDISRSDLYFRRNKNLRYHFEEFSKKGKVTKREQELIKLELEEYLSRFFTVADDILGGEVLPDYPDLHSLKLSEDIEENASALRKHLGFSEQGPLYRLTESIEDAGILVYFFDSDGNVFQGVNGTVNDRPFIVINKNMTPQKIRMTLVYEVSHLFFSWPEEFKGRKEEELADQIAEAFLFPEQDARRELGRRRITIHHDLRLICEKYGISIRTLVQRANKFGIITTNAMRKFNKKLKQIEKEQENSFNIPKEEPVFFFNLVFRAVCDLKLTVLNGARYLRVPYDFVAENCYS